MSRQVVFTFNKGELTATLQLLKKSGPGSRRPITLRVTSGPSDRQHTEPMQGIAAWSGDDLTITIDEPR